MKRKELDVVISRFNESVDWVYQLPEHAHAIIYNKGSDMLGIATPLPNMGREAHTYLHHILAVYDKLSNYESDYIAFLQGNPFDHCPDVVKQLEAEIYKADQWFTPLGHFRPMCNLDGTPHHAGLHIKEFGKLVLGMDLPEQLTFTAGAQFVIHKKLIQHYPIQFWWKLYMNAVQHPQAPWIFERTWEVIFRKEA